ncbi:hypothetical protein GDO86_006231 [Hymenochirus boettgeri]|uniref:Fanconi-associated nuclease n=1 Tax=Hymenochirus boettgeri TaxID=247094 RepID=A0A8T2JA98_9PIPI|nr:hypothetical protein GDO86_006231 [Hymenochirus boettgeri]
MKSPEKKTRKSLSLFKKKASLNKKSNQSPGNTANSSIIALFKNAPPAKLSCPLCAEMVPRFGLNKHLDETCQKVMQGADDVILIEENESKSNISHRTNTHLDSSSSILSKRGFTLSPSKSNPKETSFYFNESTNDVSKEAGLLHVEKTPIGSLASRLSRRLGAHGMEQKTQPETQDAVYCIRSLREDSTFTSTDPIKNDDVITKTNICPFKKEDEHTDTMSSVVQNGINGDNVQYMCSPNITTFLKSTKNSDKCVSSGQMDGKLFSKITEARKNKMKRDVQDERNNCKKVKHLSNPANCHTPLQTKHDGLSNDSFDKEDADIFDEFLIDFNDPGNKGEGYKLQNEVDSSRLEETALEPMRMPYYLRNFVLVLQTVMDSHEDMSLFSEEDIHVITTFFKLSAGGQKLYVRLFQRKLNWIKINKIEYSEIGSDLDPFIKELVRNAFLQSDCELQELSEALDLLSAPELKVLAKGFHLANPNAPKQQLTEELLRLSKQRNIFSLSNKQSGISAAILKKAKETAGQAIRICTAPRAVFSRVLLLFSLTESMEVEEAASGGQTQLSTVLMVNMGRLTFSEYSVQRSTRIFLDREDLIRYESAMHKLVDIVVAMSNGRWEEAHFLYQYARKDWDQLKNEPSLRSHEDLPVYLRCFTAGWVYTKILSRGVEILQRLHIYEEAVELLQILLSKQVYCSDSRGRWWDRLALNLHQHLKRTQSAISVILEGLADPYVRTGHQLALYQRAIRMRDSPSCKKFRQMFNKLPVIEVSDVPHVTIKGKMCPQTGMGKSVFIMEEVSKNIEGHLTLSTVMCSVVYNGQGPALQQDFDQGLYQCVHVHAYPDLNSH